MLTWWRRLLARRPKAGSAPSGDESQAAFTRPATWEDVVATARLLNREGARYVLVGGYALAAHGYVRMTRGYRHRCCARLGERASLDRRSRPVARRRGARARGRSRSLRRRPSARDSDQRRVHGRRHACGRRCRLGRARGSHRVAGAQRRAHTGSGSRGASQDQTRPASQGPTRRGDHPASDRPSGWRRGRWQLAGSLVSRLRVCPRSCPMQHSHLDSQ